MRRSTDRILTTHVGSLPRPADLREMWSKKTSTAEDEAALQARLRSAVGEVVLAQKKTGIDIPNDGEFGKPMRAASDRGAWGNYIFDPESNRKVQSPDRVRGPFKRSFRIDTTPPTRIFSPTQNHQ